MFITSSEPGLMYVSRKCPELRSLDIYSSTGITDLSEVIGRCNKLHKLDLTGKQTFFNSSFLSLLSLHFFSLSFFLILSIFSFFFLKNRIVSTGALHYNSSSLTKSYNSKHAKKKLNKKQQPSPFDKLSDSVIGKIFSFLTADELLLSSPRVCKRWYLILWSSSSIWNQITFSDAHYIDLNQGLRSIFKSLAQSDQSINVSSDLNRTTRIDPNRTRSDHHHHTNNSTNNDNLYLNSYNLKRTSSQLVVTNGSQLVSTSSQLVSTSNCSTENIASGSDSSSSSLSMVEVIKINSLSNSSTLTDRGLMYISKKCPELRSLTIYSSTGITDLGLSEVLARCNKLRKLDLTGKTFLPFFLFLCISFCFFLSVFFLRFLFFLFSFSSLIFSRRNETEIGKRRENERKKQREREEQKNTEFITIIKECFFLVFDPLLITLKIAF